MEGSGALILDGDLQVNAWCLYTSLEITSAKISFLPSAFYLQLYNMIYLSFCLYVDVCGGVSVCVCVLVCNVGGLQPMSSEASLF